MPRYKGKHRKPRLFERIAVVLLAPSATVREVEVVKINDLLESYRQ